MVKRPAATEETNVAIFAWLGVHAGVAKVICVKGGQEPVGCKSGGCNKRNKGKGVEADRSGNTGGVGRQDTDRYCCR